MLISLAVIGLQGRAKVSNLGDTGPSTMPTPRARMADVRYSAIADLGLLDRLGQQ